MPTFSYRARASSGKLVRGELEAASQDELAEKLRKMGYAPIKIARAVAKHKEEELLPQFMLRISNEEMVMAVVQLANMINAGLSIMASLSILQKQIENRRLKKIIGAVSADIEGGMSFSDALDRHPKVFSRLFVSMVRAGEASGNLDKILRRYAEFAEAQADLQQKVKGALFYPALLITAATLLIVFIASFIIPKFVEIFTRAGIVLPVPTVILYRVGLTVRHFWYLIILFGALIVWAIRRYIRSRPGKFNFDRFSLSLPVIGSLVRRSSISRFARTLSTLVASGVAMLQSLDIVREVLNNEVLGEVVGQMRQSAEKGEKLSDVLKVSEEFPADTVQMIAVGEETGDLAGMLNKIGDFYERAIGYSIKKLTTIVEPVFLVVMGAVVAFIMASLLLPMFDMMKLLR